jgi:hypothetical protein
MVVNKAGQRRESLTEQSRSVRARARAVITAANAAMADAVTACDAARSWRAVTSRSRHLSARHTTEVLKALDEASRDLHMLQARIDAAREDVLRPHRRQRE